MARLKKGKFDQKSRLTFAVRLTNAIPIKGVRGFFQSLRTRWEMNRVLVGRVALFGFEFALYGMLAMFAISLLGFPISIGTFLGAGSAYYLTTQLIGEWQGR